MVNVDKRTENKKKYYNTNGTRAKVKKATGKRGGSIKAYIPTDANGYMAKN